MKLFIAPVVIFQKVYCIFVANLKPHGLIYYPDELPLLWQRRHHQGLGL
jgi:hypothetical protein